MLLRVFLRIDDACPEEYRLSDVEIRFTGRLIRRLAAGLMLVFLLSVPAYAWNGIGHKATAEIAFGLLSGEQRRRISAILRAS